MYPHCPVQQCAAFDAVKSCGENGDVDPSTKAAALKASALKVYVVIQVR